MYYYLDARRCSGQWLRNRWDTLLHFNVYRNPLQVEPNHITLQIRSTRLYLGLLSLTLFILTLYSSVSVGTIIVEVDHPSLDIVQELEIRQYSLTCPCKVLSINYEYLFQLTPAYHQICSSDFVKSEWIEYFNQWFLLAYIDSNGLNYFDYGSSRFRLLASLCELSNRTVSNALFQFGKTQLITHELLQFDLFAQQINSTIEQLTQNLPNNILRLLQLLRYITNINQFMSAQRGNFGVFYLRDEQAVEHMITLASNGFESAVRSGSRTKCFCANNFTYRTDSALYVDDPINGATYYVMPRFYTGCNPMESLLQSTMECFYDNGFCLNFIDSIDTSTQYIDISPLNPSTSGRFSVDSTIDDLFTNLFIDSWSTALFYASYFNQCQPILCSYPIQERKAPLEIVTTIAGLIGGLSTILKIFSPSMISVFAYIIGRYRKRHQPRNTVIHQSKIIYRR